MLGLANLDKKYNLMGFDSFEKGNIRLYSESKIKDYGGKTLLLNGVYVVYVSGVLKLREEGEHTIELDQNNFVVYNKKTVLYLAIGDTILDVGKMLKYAGLNNHFVFTDCEHDKCGMLLVYEEGDKNLGSNCNVFVLDNDGEVYIYNGLKFLGTDRKRYFFMFELDNGEKINIRLGEKGVYEEYGNGDIIGENFKRLDKKLLGNKEVYTIRLRIQGG